MVGGGGFLQKLCSFSWGSSCEETVHTSFPHLQSSTEECRNSVFCYWLISLTCSLLVPQPQTYGNSQSKLMSHPCFGLTILCRGTWTCFQVYAGPCSVYIFIVLHLFCRKNNFSFWIFGQLSDFSDYRQQDQAGETVWLKDRYVQWVAPVWNIGVMGRVRWGPENPGNHGCAMSCYATIRRFLSTSMDK